MPVPAHRPLSARPLDLLYFAFFLTHIPATLLLDLQALYPRALVPAPLARLPELYLHLVPDPLIAGARDGGPAWVWFRTFLVLEAVFQLPVFCIGLRALWRDTNTRTLHVLLLIYAASTSTTVLPCLTTLLAPSASGAGLTPPQRALLLAAYVPFLLVPLIMGGDMALRLVAPAPDPVGVKKEE
ncbi:hypothetical protein M0805_006662 [Coniferiporia weirii]|nr:hypothetical protein M0805_006662 [Coniferiporia weirii]